MAVQIHPTTGNLLISDANQVAVDPNCCCSSGTPCVPCPDCGPDTITVVFSGITECEACRDLIGSGSTKVTPNGTAPLNGAYVLAFALVPISNCSWTTQIDNSWVERVYSDDACVTETSATNKDAQVRLVRKAGTTWNLQFFLTNTATGNPWYFFDADYDMGAANCSGLTFNISNTLTCGVTHAPSGTLPWADGGTADVTFGTCTP